MVQEYSSEDFHSSAMRASASAGSLASLPRSGVSQASHTRSRLSRSGLADLNKASGTRSYCGSQVLSHKSSAPSFSFGSGPSRLTFTGAAARGDQTLQASVSSGGAVSPGPIYNPSPSSKWLGDAPKPGFGTQEQRPSAATASGDVSRLTGKSNLPGPGSYQQPSSVGKQALGRCHSYSMYSFGNQRQRENAAKATPSPGPVYDPKGTKAGASAPPAFSFGNDVRGKNGGQSLRTPGPGTYTQKSAFGPQVHPLRKSAPSRHNSCPCHLHDRLCSSLCDCHVLQIYSMQRSSPISGFGQPGRDSSRGILPLEGRASPGPIYMNAAACKKQALSTRRSMGSMVFSRDERFRTVGNEREQSPGPGEYIV